MRIGPSPKFHGTRDNLTDLIPMQHCVQKTKNSASRIPMSELPSRRNYRMRWLPRRRPVAKASVSLVVGLVAEGRWPARLVARLVALNREAPRAPDRTAQAPGAGCCRPAG